MFAEGFPFKTRAALLLAALMTLSLTIFGQTSSGEVNGAIIDITQVCPYATRNRKPL